MSYYYTMMLGKCHPNVTFHGMTLVATDRRDFHPMMHANVCDKRRQTAKICLWDYPLIAAM